LLFREQIAIGWQSRDTEKDNRFQQRRTTRHAVLLSRAMVEKALG
jgi:hypothetical protein